MYVREVRRVSAAVAAEVEDGPRRRRAAVAIAATAAGPRYIPPAIIAPAVTAVLVTGG